jgi:hypothetical protein
MSAPVRARARDIIPLRVAFSGQIAVKAQVKSVAVVDRIKPRRESLAELIGGRSQQLMFKRCQSDVTRQRRLRRFQDFHDLLRKHHVLRAL